MAKVFLEWKSYVFNFLSLTWSRWTLFKSVWRKNVLVLFRTCVVSIHWSLSSVSLWLFNIITSKRFLGDINYSFHLSLPHLTSIYISSALISTLTESFLHFPFSMHAPFKCYPYSPFYYFACLILHHFQFIPRPHCWVTSSQKPRPISCCLHSPTGLL